MIALARIVVDLVIYSRKIACNCSLGIPMRLSKISMESLPCLSAGSR